MRLFLAVMNIILLMMVFGFTLLLHQLSPTLHKLLGKLMTHVSIVDRPLNVILQANLRGHTLRNNKTSIMFSIALSFLIFSGCIFALESDTIISSIRMLQGADLVAQVIAPSKFVGLPEMELKGFLDMQKQMHRVEEYAFISRKLHVFLSQELDSSIDGKFGTLNSIRVNRKLFYQRADLWLGRKLSECHI
jgi:hypothetical protein